MNNEVLGYLFPGRRRTTLPRPAYGNGTFWAPVLGGLSWVAFVVLVALSLA